MTVAVSCNLSDGVVLAVDSAVTLADNNGNIVKVYENAEKLFQLGDRPIGVSTYGLGEMGQRSVGSYVREFETLDSNGVVTGQTSVTDVVEALRDFFVTQYTQHVVPVLEQATGTPFDQIPKDQIPILGLIVGGFSSGTFLSEVWEIQVPLHDTQGSATNVRAPGQLGTNWFAMYEPIRRYIKGFDPQLLDAALNYVLSQRGGQPLNPQEVGALQAILDQHEYQIPFSAMPLREGIEHTRFLAELVVNHHRYAVGAPVVGGRVKVGSVTYRGERFTIHRNSR